MVQWLLLLAPLCGANNEVEKIWALGLSLIGGLSQLVVINCQGKLHTVHCALLTADYKTVHLLYFRYCLVHMHVLSAKYLKYSHRSSHCMHKYRCHKRNPINSNELWFIKHCSCSQFDKLPIHFKCSRYSAIWCNKSNIKTKTQILTSEFTNFYCKFVADSLKKVCIFLRSLAYI